MKLNVIKIDLCTHLLIQDQDDVNHFRLNKYIPDINQINSKLKTIFRSSFLDVTLNTPRMFFNSKRIYSLIDLQKHLSLNRVFPSGLCIIVPKIRHNYNALYGVMFDFGRYDGNHMPREGIALSLEYIKQIQHEEFLLFFIRTLCHELGHLFSLHHPKHPDNYIMTPFDLTTGNRKMSFSNSSIKKLLDPEHRRNRINPGTGKPFIANDIGDVSLKGRENKFTSIKLSISTKKDEYLIGEPVYLRIALTNTGDEHINFSSNLQIISGDIDVIISDKFGKSKFYYSPICIDGKDSSMINIPPGKELLRNMNITYGMNGFSFSSNGIYKIQAFCKAIIDNEYINIESNIYHIKINPPTNSSEIELSYLFLDPQIYLIGMNENSFGLSHGISSLNKLICKYHNKDSVQVAKLFLAKALMNEEKNNPQNILDILLSIDDRKLDYEQILEVNEMIKITCSLDCLKKNRERAIYRIEEMQSYLNP